MSISSLPKNDLGINRIHTVDSQAQKGEQESIRCVQNRMKRKHEAAGEKKLLMPSGIIIRGKVNMIVIVYIPQYNKQFI